MFQKQASESDRCLPVTPVRRNRTDIARIHQNGRHLAELFRAMSQWIRPGVTGTDINDFVTYYIKQRKLTPILNGYRNFTASCCVSPGATAVHGIPDDTPIHSGELVTVDVAVERDGWIADSAWTFAVGSVSDEYKRLLKGAYATCLAGIAVAREGVTVRSLARTIVRAAQAYGLHVMSECCGHGVGRELHEPPVMPYLPEASTSTTLAAGQVITVEPVVSLEPQALTRFADITGMRGSLGAPCAQFEHTIAVGKNGAQTLTMSQDSDVDFRSFF